MVSLAFVVAFVYTEALPVGSVDAELDPFSLLSSLRVPKSVKKEGSSCLCVARESCTCVDNTEIDGKAVERSRAPRCGKGVKL